MGPALGFARLGQAATLALTKQCEGTKAAGAHAIG